MRLIIDLTQRFANGIPCWAARCRQLHIHTMAYTKRGALVLLAKRMVRIKNEELEGIF